MKIDKNKIKTEYLNVLQEYRQDIKSLDAEERSNGIEYAKMYYNYLIANNILYGKLALDVVENKGKLGQLANIHLKSQSIFEGIKPELIEETRERIIIRLAYKDAQMRSQSKYDQSDNSYQKIEKYHEQIFKSHTTAYAWGGLALKELVGSGTWLELYVQGESIFEAILPILTSEKIGKSQNSEYSVERMLQSVAHSYRIFSSGIEMPFQLMMSAVSKEQAALIWKIDPDRISEIEDDTSMLDSVSSKVFKARAAEYFVPSREIDYSSSDSEAEGDFSEALSANKVINKQLQALLSNPSNLKSYQQASLNNAFEDLKLAEELVPNITKSSLESITENNGFIQELIGIKNPKQEEEKIKVLEQEEAKIMPVIEDLVQHVKHQAIYTSGAQNVISKENNSSQTASEQKSGQDWLNNLVSNTQTAMNDAYNDPDMQQFLQTLGNNSGFKFDDDA